MVYSSQNEAFLRDKNQFFGKLPKGEMKQKIETVENKAGRINYSFLLENQKALEDEFIQMFAVLKNKKEENEESFWLYCYYTATLLETFYRAYSQKGKEEEYKKLKLKIKNRLLKVEEDEATSDESFIKALEKYFIDSFRNLMKSPIHLSQIRDYVAYSNLCRVYWVFCRQTLTTGLTLARDLQIIDKLDAVLGTHTDVDKIITTIHAPNGVLNYLSVGFFLGRFVIDAGLLIRHTFFPTEEEKRAGTTALERFKFELYKRHCNFINDIVWATVNFLTNFNHITHIPNPVASAVTAVFLGLDVCLTLYKCHLAKQEFLVKKAQYEQEIKDYSDTSKFLDLTPQQRSAHILLLKKQIDELEINWKTKEGTFHFVAAGAALLALGFTATLLFTPPGIIFASFFVCTLGVAMYLSAGAYSTYKEKNLRLEKAQLIGEDLDTALREYQAARNDFIFTMIKNTVMPTLIIATFAICWPAAIALTVLYTGYELYHAYSQHNSKKEPTPPLTLEFSDSSEAQDEEVVVEESHCCFV